MKKIPVMMALVGSVALGNGLIIDNALAASVKCYGISQAGKNDCQSTGGKHSCQGQAKTDYDGQEWKNVATKEACAEQMGELTPFNGKNPKKKG